MNNSEVPKNVLLKEQSQLLKAEKKLDEMIGKIEYVLNELLVENFQLTSNQINLETDSPSVVEVKPSTSKSQLPPEIINKQKLNLNLTNVSKYYNDEEEQDDDNN